jgi:O-acetyl-ADP-ribose deacetylase (regulator of RNase III)
MDKSDSYLQKKGCVIEINIFDSPAQTIVNTVNTVGVMGKGIALTYKKLYPEMYKEYRKLCDEKKFTIGNLYIYRTSNKIIVNFPTKTHWRNPSSLDYIKTGLIKFTKIYQSYGISSVSFPQLGCGNGELDWEKQVQPMMEKYLRDLPIPVYVHLYAKDPNFIPERLDDNYARQVRLERQRISTSKLWQDLYNIVGGGNIKSYQMSLFGPEIEVQDEMIIFNPNSKNVKIVYREDIEDLWNVLRIRGIISEIDIPETIKTQGVIEWLFNFLERLDYIRPEHIRKRGVFENRRGLQYSPLPEPSPIDTIDILV